MTFNIPSTDQDDPRYTKRGALFLPSGTGVTKWVFGDIYTVKATGSETHGGFSVVEATVPSGNGPVAHVHNASDEAFYLLSGELEFLDGDRTFIARAGDFVLIPRGIRHRFKNNGLHATKMLFFFTPPGVEQAFIEDGDTAVVGGAPARWDLERVAQFQEVGERLGIDSDVLPEQP